MSNTLSDNQSLHHPKPEFEHTLYNNGDGTYRAWASVEEIKAVVPVTQRLNKMFRVAAGLFMCNQDDTFTDLSTGGTGVTIVQVAADEVRTLGQILELTLDGVTYQLQIVKKVS